MKAIEEKLTHSEWHDMDMDMASAYPLLLDDRENNWHQYQIHPFQTNTVLQNYFSRRSQWTSEFRSPSRTQSYTTPRGFFCTINFVNRPECFGHTNHICNCFVCGGLGVAGSGGGYCCILPPTPLSPRDHSNHRKFIQPLTLQTPEGYWAQSGGWWLWNVGYCACLQWRHPILVVPTTPHREGALTQIKWK